MAAVRVLFHVQHLLGIGHLVRAAALARACAEEGLEVTVASGGEPTPGIDFGRAAVVQLPPARIAGRCFTALVDERGAPIDDAWRARRKERLLAIYREAAPDVVLTELFPFGRRRLRFELLPLLERCAADRARTGRPRVACSVRDILVESPKPERTRETLDLVRRYYERVLVHGDPRFVPLDATFPHAAEVADRIVYTGYVVSRTTPPAAAAGGSRVPRGGGAQGQPAGSGGEVIVSAGGGAVGGKLLEASLLARPRTRLAAAPWRLLAGPNLAADEFRTIAAQAPGGVVVERFRPDFRALLRGARLSISQGGYNTLMDVLDAKRPAVVAPYAEGGETEQTLRANLLAARGLVEVVGGDGLAPASLAEAVDRACARPPCAALADLDTGGAAATVEALRALGT